MFTTSMLNKTNRQHTYVTNEMKIKESENGWKKINKKIKEKQKIKSELH